MIKTELYEIPYRLELCYQKNKGLILPEKVPYIGMGASYIAIEVFRYLGVPLFAANAAEYEHYLGRNRKDNTAVLVSQSGQSAETLNCARYFSSFIGIVNDAGSPLARQKNCDTAVLLHSGTEERIVSKSYLNTLLVLYLGLGFELKDVLQVHRTHLLHFEQIGIAMGALIKKSQRSWHKRFIYILGNGADNATAKLAAQVLSSVLKTPVAAVAASQFDHGFKTSPKNMLVLALNPGGAERERTQHLLQTIGNEGAEVFEISDPIVAPVFSPLIFPMYFFFAAEYLTDPSKIKSVFDWRLHK